MSVYDLIRQQDEAAAHRVQFVLWPKLWSDFSSKKMPRFRWEVYPFQPEFTTKIPKKAGIYSFLVQPGIALHPSCSYLVYIGKTSRQLRARFREYLTEMTREIGRPKIIRLLNKYTGHIYFCCSPLSNIKSVTRVENALLGAFVPPFNDTLPAEVTRIIRGLS